MGRTRLEDRFKRFQISPEKKRKEKLRKGRKKKTRADLTISKLGNIIEIIQDGVSKGGLLGEKDKPILTFFFLRLREKKEKGI